MRLRYRVMYSVLTLLSVVCTGCQIEAKKDPKVVFQNQKFQAVFDRVKYIEHEDDFDFETILPTQSQLNKMTALNLWFLKGEECSLEDLKKFPNLRGLYIERANESVIQQVSEQKQLRALSIRVYEPTNMSLIGTMDQVKALGISAPGVKAGEMDWSFIENMGQLETLYIEAINLNDLSFLKSLPNLEHLVIEDVDIGDVSDIKALSEIKYLSIYNDSKNTYSQFMKNLCNMEQLEIHGLPQMNDLNFLKNMNKLTRLGIEDIGIEEIPEWFTVENYPSLVSLSVDDEISNTNRKIINRILPILEERERNIEVPIKFHDIRMTFPRVLEYMTPVEAYDE